MSFNLVATLLAWAGQWWTVAKEASLAEVSWLLSGTSAGDLWRPSPYYHLLLTVNLLGVAATSCIGVHHYLYPEEGRRRNVFKAILTAVDLDTPYFVITQGMHYVQGHDAQAADIPALRQRNAYFRGMPTAMVGVVVAFRCVIAYKVDQACLIMAMRFDKDYGASAESEFQRVLLPPFSKVNSNALRNVVVPFFREVGHLEKPRTRDVTEVLSVSEYVDRSLGWGAFDSDWHFSFDGYAALMVEAKVSISTSIWKILSSNPAIYAAMKLKGISTPASLHQASTKMCRNNSHADFKVGDGRRGFSGDSGRAGSRFMLRFDTGSFRRDILYALFQFLTAAKAICEQAPHFRSLGLVQKGVLYLHVVLDGVLVIGALLVSFVVISGMSFWDGFVNMWEQIIRETLASQNIVAAMSWDEVTLHEQITIPTLSGALPVLKPLLQDLRSPSADLEASRLAVLFACLAIMHGLSVLLLGSAVYDLHAIVTSPLASFGKRGRTLAESMLVMIGKVGLLVLVYVPPVLTSESWAGFCIAVSFSFNCRLPFLGYSCMLFVMLFLLLVSGWAAAAAMEAAGQQAADTQETDSWGYQLAQWPPAQCACADPRKKQRRRRQEAAAGESAPPLPRAQPLATSYGACASSGAA